MKNPTFKIAAAAMMVAGAFATQTYAAGFQLSEQSAIQMGRAMAGAGVVGDDLSAVHYNPAGMTLLSGTRMQATGTWVAVNLDYEGDSGQSENGRLKGQIIPAGFITHQINDSLWAGLGLTVPYGMGTEFGEGWEGRERGTESMILTFDINPNLAWKVNEIHLSPRYRIRSGILHLKYKGQPRWAAPGITSPDTEILTLPLRSTGALR